MIRKLKYLHHKKNLGKNDIEESYANDNSAFDEKLGLAAWYRTLSKIVRSEISSYRDCGSNISRNIAFLKKFFQWLQQKFLL